jgi:hypothetical protein
MKTFTHRFIIVAQALLVILMMVLTGCGRNDTRVNSDPGSGRTSSADGGDKAVRPDPNQAAPASGGTSATTGTDSTGRPSDASGGTTAAGSGSGTSGTATGQQAGPVRK